MNRPPLTRLAEVIPVEHAVMALVWFANELCVECHRRDVQAIAQHDLGVSPLARQAFMEATRDLRDLADRYDHALADDHKHWPEGRS